MSNIRLNKIKIPQVYINSGVSDKKLIKKLRLIENGYEPVVTLNNNNIIIDGYATYLAYKQLGYKYIPFIRQGHSTNRRYILDKANGICYICGRKLPYNELTIDHMKPKALGGADDESNLKCCCILCNSLKGQLSYSKELRAIIRRELIVRGIQIV